ncbi:hypothetical protein Pelo_6320 [Pelomyxa schiedti]|nr:hypothetical protein Pelo_6320 [Pelomyxa schiedti]
MHRLRFLTHRPLAVHIKRFHQMTGGPIPSGVATVTANHLNSNAVNESVAESSIDSDESFDDSESDTAMYTDQNTLSNGKKGAKILHLNESTDGSALTNLSPALFAALPPIIPAHELETIGGLNASSTSRDCRHFVAKSVPALSQRDPIPTLDAGSPDSVSSSDSSSSLSSSSSSSHSPSSLFCISQLSQQSEDQEHLSSMPTILSVSRAESVHDTSQKSSPPTLMPPPPPLPPPPLAPPPAPRLKSQLNTKNNQQKNNSGLHTNSPGTTLHADSRVSPSPPTQIVSPPSWQSSPKHRHVSSPAISPTPITPSIPTRTPTPFPSFSPRLPPPSPVSTNPKHGSVPPRIPTPFPTSVSGTLFTLPADPLHIQAQYPSAQTQKGNNSDYTPSPTRKSSICRSTSTPPIKTTEGHSPITYEKSPAHRPKEGELRNSPAHSHSPYPVFFSLEQEFDNSFPKFEDPFMINDSSFMEYNGDDFLSFNTEPEPTADSVRVGEGGLSSPSGTSLDPPLQQKTGLVNEINSNQASFGLPPPGTIITREEQTETSALPIQQLPPSLALVPPLNSVQPIPPVPPTPPAPQPLNVAPLPHNVQMTTALVPQIPVQQVQMIQAPSVPQVNAPFPPMTPSMQFNPPALSPSPPSFSHTQSILTFLNPLIFTNHLVTTLMYKIPSTNLILISSLPFPPTPTSTFLIHIMRFLPLHH